MSHLQIRKIGSFDAPEVAPYRTMRRSAEHEAQGIFIAEGEKVVRRLLESHFTVVSIVLPEKWLETYRPRLEARPEPIAVYLAEKKLRRKPRSFADPGWTRLRRQKKHHRPHKNRRPGKNKARRQKLRGQN